MILSRDYRIALIAAITLHVCIAIVLFAESSSSERPVLTLEAKNDASQAQPLAEKPQEEVIKATSVDNREVMAAVNRLKEERLHQQKVEDNRQKALVQQAEMARNQRVAEQKRLETLKNEAAQLAVVRKKQMIEDQLHLKQLARQKLEEEKHLADMKQQQVQMQKQQQLQAQKQKQLQEQQQEAIKLAELKKKNEADIARANQEREAKTRDLLAQKQQAAAVQTALDSEKTARISGEVDKYKALIINAISRQWILPEHANSSMSSQFRIRLAPNGVVLEVSLTRSSGDSILDRSAQSAIYKASPLPVPNDADAFNVFRDISLTVRPESARG